MRTSLISAVVAALLFISSNQVKAAPIYGWHLGHVGVTKELHEDLELRAVAHVGVLDEGAMWWHQEIDGRTAYLANRLNCPGSKGNAGVCIGNHGTHVATTIGASDTTGEMVGVAPKAHLYSYAFFGSSGVDGAYGANGVNRDWGDLYSYFRARGVAVTNHSYGFFASALSASDIRLIDREPNNVFVWAAGNNSFDLKNIIMADNFQAKDEIQNLLMVVALDTDGTLASFSNTPGKSAICNVSSAVCLERNSFKYYTVAAPGVNICAGVATGTGTDYGCWAGTSMAAPIVTGVVALMHAHWPALKSDPAKVTEIIFKTALDLGTPGVDETFGWGLVRADRALGPLGETYLSATTGSSGDGSYSQYVQGNGDLLAAYNNGVGPSGSMEEWGKWHWNAYGKNEPHRNAKPVTGKKSFGLSKSRLKVSSALSALTQHRVSFFDAYDRDFQIPLATYAPSYQGILENWMKNSVDHPETTSVDGDGLSYSFSARDYNPLDPSLSDIQWGMSYQRVDGNTFHFGQGSALDRLDLPGSLTFGLMADKTIQAGAYPVMGLAEGGVYALIERSMSSGFTMTGGALTNVGLAGEADDRDYAPKADALMLSLGRVSEDKKLSGSISATYLIEDDGVLGTGGTGGLSFTDGSESQAITVGSSYQLNDKSKISTSYTESFSRGDTSSGQLLSLDSTRLTSSAFTVGLESRKLLSDTDRLNFSVSQPLRVSSGSMSLLHDDYYDEDEILHTRSVDIDLASTGRQIDYQLQYIFAPKQKAFTVGLFAYYADDYLHQANAADYGAGLRIQGKF